jgi:ATP-dependent DNA helicase DinG
MLPSKGTGKTLAYLLPAIMSDQRVIVSTATKALQEQLFSKDLPFLHKHFAPELKVALMKGRGNFLCLQKVRQMEAQPVLKGLDEVDWFSQIRQWSALTETGDRAELDFLTDDSELWHKLDARADTCTGQKCPDFDRCFITQMHRRAHQADVIIVNHHLFFADLAIRKDDFGAILPDYSAVIFDEAHEIEEVAGSYFGRQSSSYRFEEVARDSDLAMRLTRVDAPSLARRVPQLREKARAFFEMFPSREGRFPFPEAERSAFLARNNEAFRAITGALERLETEIAALPSKPEELLAIARRSAELRRDLTFLLESAEKNYVYWFERRARGVFLAATPINVSDILRQNLFNQFDTVLLTSATLAVSGQFNFLRQRLGVDPTIEESLASEFDYFSQAILYIPPQMPDVRSPEFSARATAEIVKILEITDGRAFCLFTSYAQMRDVHERLSKLVRFPLLLQGTAPRSVLLDRFKNKPGAVLLATSSFWQGVDVPGEQLSCVIIDKLPFAVPSDPIVAARIKALTDEGRNAFAEYQVPEAVLALKQGFGRLIRARSDRGVLAILDNRIRRMQYGKIFLESLPAYSVTQELAELARFMSHPTADGTGKQASRRKGARKSHV